VSRDVSLERGDTGMGVIKGGGLSNIDLPFFEGVISVGHFCVLVCLWMTFLI